MDDYYYEQLMDDTYYTENDKNDVLLTQFSIFIDSIDIMFAEIVCKHNIHSSQCVRQLW